MDKQLNTRSLIISIFWNYANHYENNIWIGSLIRLLDAFDYSEQSVRAAVSRMSKRGWIASERKRNNSFYSLTKKGLLMLEEDFAQFEKLKREKWDGKWRMLVYTIPEKKRELRDQFREALIEKGFGLIANSCWITPYPLDIEKITNKYKIDAYVSFFHATYEGANDYNELVERCWDLSEINDHYADFINKYEELYTIDQQHVQNDSINNKEFFVTRTLLNYEYKKLLFTDPKLPKELLPNKWQGKIAANLYEKYDLLLKDPAIDFFTSTHELGNQRLVANR